MGIGAVCHTLNPRLSDRDIAYIADHGQDKFIMVDTTFLPIISRILKRLPNVQGIIVLTDRQHMPTEVADIPCQKLLCFDDLLEACAPQLHSFTWPDIHEDSPAGLCYTSGTTGNPKGVRYTHRSNFLHATIVTQSDALCLGSQNTVLMVVPMFHANSWGMNFAAPMVGARLVLPGPALDGASLHQMLETYKVDVTAAVPTVVLGLLQHMARNKLPKPTQLRRIVIGGAAAPRTMIETLEGLGVEVRHMWGMTEISPLGSIGVASGSQVAAGLSQNQLIGIKVSQGRPHVFCDMRIVDDAGKELPQDGQTVGNLQVRGPIVVQQYHRHNKQTVTAGKWFDTGDVASIDQFGNMRISDRSKDVIKSGGEWISSIQLENTAMGHPKVLEAAVIAMPDERWGERPMLIIVPQSTAGADHEALRLQVLAYMAQHPQVAKFAQPDDVVVVKEIPHTATGKVSKLTLRQQFKDYKPRKPASKL
eukprot:GHRR01013957.1.p1 GENE.GHRR01013957.1~~GHRR01013957.1.p1  ORF type:complete len:477 (+),score=139.27 GHRR01013957.1:1442-2872(+)